MWTHVKEFGNKVPGILLCLIIVLAAEYCVVIETHIFGRDWLGTLVVAILLGVVVRTLWHPPKQFSNGIAFSGKTILEVAIVLLGASLSAEIALAAGWKLLVGIVGAVAVAILISFAIGRILGLSPKLATLVACGNSICGNSAIAAAAPIIRADGSDVAASISFTAVLGVVIVLSLPILAPLLSMSDLQYGILAGMTVYAVPQVLAATTPIGVTSVQIGTLVKLIRVLMLGPVLLGLGLIYGRSIEGKFKLKQLVPWFIVGFIAMAFARSVGLIRADVLEGLSWLGGTLTIVAMAALGLSVDIRTVANAGVKVTATVILSIVVLAAISLGMIRLLNIA